MITKLSQRILLVRKLFDKSQAQFAKSLGVTPSYISELEADKKINLSKTMLFLIEATYFVDTCWIISGEINTLQSSMIKDGLNSSRHNWTDIAEGLNVRLQFLEAITENKVKPSLDFIRRVGSITRTVYEKKDENLEFYKNENAKLQGKIEQLEKENTWLKDIVQKKKG